MYACIYASFAIDSNIAIYYAHTNWFCVVQENIKS